MVSGYVSVATGAHTSAIFSVSGTQTLGFAQSFAAAVANLPAQNYQNLSTTGGAIHGQPPAGVTEYLLIGSGAPVSATVPAGGGYVFDSWSGPATITGSGSGDTLLAGAVNTATTYNDVGGNNQIIFAEGTNLYNGTAATGNDTVVTGSGYDTVITGTNDTTVIGGTGQSHIFLNDTSTSVTAASGYNDQAWLNDGRHTVVASGYADAVVANAAGEQIWANGGTGSILTVTLGTQAGSGLSAGSITSDTIGATGTGNVAVWDYTSGNEIYGNTVSGGLLTFVAGPGPSTGGVTANVVGSSGGNVIFGNYGADINFYAPSTATSPAILVAGGGNETLNGANSAGNQIFWGFAQDSSGSAISNEVLWGGQGNDTMVTGTGNETILSGAGANLFVVNNDTASSAAHTITLQDFGTSANNLVQFANYDAATVQQALDNATVTMNGSTPELTLTLGNTTVNFVGVSSLNGHIS